ncbi:hypothetical protein Ddc_04604 [Ditylenchus destructor]|nr:hypothetical protein Ddc_04604 [Ditylenchus destructor]
MPQHIYPKFFRDILNYLDRCELGKIQTNCRLADRLVDNDFPEKPYHVWDSLVVEKGKKNVINVFLRNKSKDMKIVESLAHLWEGQFVTIYPGFADEDKAYREGLQHDLNLLLNTSAIFRCRELELSGVNIAFANYQLLYSVSVLRVVVLEEHMAGHVTPEHWVDFLENIDQNGGKVVPFLWLEPIHELMELLDAIRVAFSKSNKPCKFKLYTIVAKDEPVTEFLDANETSHEMLQFSSVPESAAKSIFEKLTNFHEANVLLYLLERMKE